MRQTATTGAQMIGGANPDAGVRCPCQAREKCRLLVVARSEDGEVVVTQRFLVDSVRIPIQDNQTGTLRSGGGHLMFHVQNCLRWAVRVGWFIGLFDGDAEASQPRLR